MTLKPLSVLWRIFALLVTSIVTGGGIGFIEGRIVARTWEREEQISFSADAGLLGMALALIVGPVLYFVLGRRVTFSDFAGIVTVGTLAGAVVALVNNEFWVLIAACLGVGIATAIVASLRKRGAITPPT